ncbi:glycosyltransferase family 2 protein [Halocola ammonii]
MSDLISILMPVRNAAPFLEDCLASIQQQTLENWELIAVDDNSTDDSYATLQSFAKRDSRILVLKNRESGIIPALRLALSNSSGTLITRMDADDVMPSDKLKTLSETCKAEGEKAIATGKVSYFSDGELMDGFIRYQNWLNELVEKGNPFQQIFRECPIASPNWMMKRPFFERIDAFEPNVYPEDYDLIFRAFIQGAQPVFSQKVTHLWRDHETRASRTDENYADNSFFELKLNYFLQLFPNEKIGLYGAGKKGKRLAQMLIDRNVSFRWFSNNRKKIGREIYGIYLEEDNLVFQSSMKSKMIVAISSPEKQEEIYRMYDEARKQEGRDYFFFC